MDKKKVFLIIQSLLWILVAGLLIVSVISIYRDGTVLRAEDPLAVIFSREIAANAFRVIAPLFLAAIGMTVAGLFLGIRDEDGLKPVKGGKVENRAPEGKTLRTALLVAAIVLIVAGVFNGSARDVFGKAVKICTECIGLG